MLALRLPPAIELRLARLASVTGKSKSHFARQAIIKHIEEIEAELAIEGADQGDDPFGAFTEWDSAADRRAYGNL